MNFRPQSAYLHFKNGPSFQGKLIGNFTPQEFEKGFWGEATFTTGMSGYQETLTDPSFLGQHVLFSNPHIGNYPPNKEALQSAGIHCSAIMAKSFSDNPIWGELNVPLFFDLDTRKLVRYLSQGGVKSHISILTTRPEVDPGEFSESKLKCNRLDLVSQNDPQVIIEGKNPIVLINYGVKNSILEQLKKLNRPLVTLGHKASSLKVTSLNPSMIFLSNGPGDPRSYKEEIAEVKKMLELDVPVRGICLGHQLLTLALGGEIIKLPFGQRGPNHPVIDHETGKIQITSQNHGYSSSEESILRIANKNPLNKELYISYRSLFDETVEGIKTSDGFLKSVQFHPEANPGPKDCLSFFSEIENYLRDREKNSPPPLFKTEDLFPLPETDLSRKEIPFKKVLLIGSGPIKIGQASEFDYSGTQACKSLKALGVEVVLINSNPATIMTDPHMAHKTYIEPITLPNLKKIIVKEKVDAVISTMGGQTALNYSIQLEEEGFLKENGVTLLGANADTIRKTEDRDLFAQELQTLGMKTGIRLKAKNKEEALKLAKVDLGLPLIIRRDFALGGKGAAVVETFSELEHILDNTDLKFPLTLEKSLIGWKEIELEVMVDKDENGIIICSIENIDPCGVHTGDSITVAPAQTISDHCYQNLRTMALRIAKHMKVVAGGANVQFAINPNDEDDIVVIEMNPRVSRSSALASKASGYPIAKISALLAMGFNLKEILNDITKISPVSFEPTLDYVAIKIPLFPFNKFPTTKKTLGPQMRSVGEVLSLGSTFNEALMKAFRSLEMGLEIPTLTRLKNIPLKLTHKYLSDRLKTPHELSILAAMDGMRKGMTTSEIFELSKISPWFLNQVKKIVDMEDQIKEKSLEENFTLNKEELLSYKKMGFSDKHLAHLLNLGQEKILEMRFSHNLFPVYKAVDTCSGEFKAFTPYFYSTYEEENEAIPYSLESKSVVVLGSGPNRIGQGIEFDYSCVKSCKRLNQRGIKSIMVNSNPETVSTDYDSSDRLYLAPLFSEDLFDILHHEKPWGVITAFSGQTGISIRDKIENSFRKNFKEFNFLGSSWEALELTEDRNRFAKVTKDLDLATTKSKEVKGLKNLMNAIIDEIGLPVIIRPSYVIGGESMYLFHSFDEIMNPPKTLRSQLDKGTTSFLAETYLDGALEYDVDLIRDQEGKCFYTVCEHIEYAGVHSGDSGMVTPPVHLKESVAKKMEEISKTLAERLEIIGPINFQFAIKNNLIYCIEANPRGSRTLPFLSKAFHLDLPGLATDAMCGISLPNWDGSYPDAYCVKQSTFPFDRFLEDNIILGPKMRSTGETMGIDYKKEFASLKSYLGNYPQLAGPGIILLSLADKNKKIILPYLSKLKEKGIELVGTPGTASFIQAQGYECQMVSKIQGSRKNLLETIKDKDLKMVLNTPFNQGQSQSDGEKIRNMATSYGIPCFTRPENIEEVLRAIFHSPHMDPMVEIGPLSLQELHEIKEI